MAEVRVASCPVMSGKACCAWAELGAGIAQLSPLPGPVSHLWSVTAQMPAHPSFPLYGLRPLSALIRNWLLSSTPSFHYHHLATRLPTRALPERSPSPLHRLLPKLRLTPLLPLSQATAGCPVKSLSQAPPSATRGIPSVAGVLVQAVTWAFFTLFLRVLVALGSVLR